MDNTVFSKGEVNLCTPVNGSLHSSAKNRSLECKGLFTRVQQTKCW